MRLNKKNAAPRTHEDAVAAKITPLQQLRRSVLSCLLWEDEFYEDGQSIAERIAETARHVNPVEIAALAIEARHEQHLRHVPLLLLCSLAECARGEALVADTIECVVSRADEIAELCAVYWRDGKKPLSAQMKKGLARAFAKFDAYQFAKYDRDTAVKLADVIRLVRPKPADEARAALYKGVRERSLASPDTWEVALSGGADKKETFERLLREKKLGYLALLRNLRNMEQAEVDTNLVRKAIVARRGAERVLPFRYVAAARACPQFEPELDAAFCEASATGPRLKGTTLVVIDVSGSMYHAKLSRKSDMTRALAACALGAIARNACQDPLIYATAGSDTTRIHKTQIVPARSGMALVDAIHGMCAPLGGGGIFLNQVMRFLREKHPVVDRVIVITDEQDCGIGSDLPANAPAYGKVSNYMLNVASARNGIGYPGTGWTHIDGFSENVLRFIHETERQAGPR